MLGKPLGESQVRYHFINLSRKKKKIGNTLYFLKIKINNYYNYIINLKINKKK